MMPQKIKNVFYTIVFFIKLCLIICGVFILSFCGVGFIVNQLVLPGEILGWKQQKSTLEDAIKTNPGAIENAAVVNTAMSLNAQLAKWKLYNSCIIFNPMIPDEVNQLEYIRFRKQERVE